MYLLVRSLLKFSLFVQDKPVFTVQFHPEHSAGPEDLECLFDAFLGRGTKGKNVLLFVKSFIFQIWWLIRANPLHPPSRIGSIRSIRFTIPRQPKRPKFRPTKSSFWALVAFPSVEQEIKTLKTFFCQRFSAWPSFTFFTSSSSSNLFSFSFILTLH